MPSIEDCSFDAEPSAKSFSTLSRMELFIFSGSVGWSSSSSRRICRCDACDSPSRDFSVLDRDAGVKFSRISGVGMSASSSCTPCADEGEATGCTGERGVSLLGAKSAVGSATGGSLEDAG